MPAPGEIVAELNAAGGAPPCDYPLALAYVLETFTEIDSAYYMDRQQALAACDDATLRQLVTFGRAQGRLAWFLKLADDAEAELSRRGSRSG